MVAYFYITFVHVPFPWTESLIVFPGLVSYDLGIEAYMTTAGSGKEEREEGRKEGRKEVETL